MNVSLTTFKGTAPKLDPRLLAPEYAQTSINLNYDSGALVPLKNFEKIADITTSNITAMFKYRVSDTVDKWLYFEDDVMLTRDPIYSGSDNRVIISGMGAPRVFDSSSIVSTDVVNTSNSYLLGLPVPATPTIAVSSVGTGYFESRSYTIQYDRVWSDGKIDQGAYSSPGTTSGGDLYVDVTTNGSVSISNIPDAPSGYGITHITINRSGTSTKDTHFHFVSTFNIADAKLGTVSGVTWNSGTNKFTVVDSIITADLGMECSNQDYTAPEDTLRGIIKVNSGMLAGFYDNIVCFSDPYQIHAWPEQYKVAVGNKIVGLGSFGEIVVVCTDAEPYIISLSDPSSAIAFPIKEFAPCIKASGIVSYRDAVVYPSQAGFIRIDRLGVANITQNLATLKNIKDLDMNLVHAVGLGPYYYVLYTTSTGQVNVLTLNMQDPGLGIGFCNSNISCLYSDFESASLYAVYTNNDGTHALGVFDLGTDLTMTFIWKSKVFLMPEDSNTLSAARITFDGSVLGSSSLESAQIMKDSSINSWAYNDSPINGWGISIPANVSPTKFLTFCLYVDGVLKFVKYMNDDKPFRLPAGFVGREFEIYLSGNVPVYKIDVATSMTELVG